MKHKKWKVMTICVCVIGMLMAIPLISNAVQYSTYNINVKDEYEYVDMTPQVIYTKSNMPVPTDLLTSSWDFDYYTIVIWYKLNGVYTPIDQYTFDDYNGDFGMNIAKYKKHWYSTSYHWKFTGIVEDTPQLYFPFEGKYKVFVEIKGEVTYWYWDITFETFDFKVSGLSGSFTVEAS